jgi:hypothetical protein
MLADYFHIDPASLGDKNIGDPRAADETDIAALRDSPSIPGTFRVTGVVYDVDNGREASAGRAGVVAATGR